MESEKIQATIFVFYVFRTSWLHGMNLFFVQYRVDNLSNIKFSDRKYWILSSNSDGGFLKKNLSSTSTKIRFTIVEKSRSNDQFPRISPAQSQYV